MKSIDLTNKCGSCPHFKPVDGTAIGECLLRPYGEDVVHDPNHPYQMVPRSKVKCPWHNSKPMTNADKIRAMTDDELADWLARTQIENVAEVLSIEKIPYEITDDVHDAVKKVCLEWLKQPAEVDE